jgi:hypothetical protein
VIDLPLVKDEEVYVLHVHRDLAEAGEEVPQFVYRPLGGREAIEWTRRIMREERENGSGDVAYIDLCAERLIRVENLTIGGEPYRHPEHLEQLPLRWRMAVGIHIYSRTLLGPEELGKYSWPAEST